MSKKQRISKKQRPFHRLGKNASVFGIVQQGTYTIVKESPIIVARMRFLIDEIDIEKYRRRGNRKKI